MSCCCFSGEGGGICQRGVDHHLLCKRITIFFTFYVILPFPLMFHSEVSFLEENGEIKNFRSLLRKQLILVPKESSEAASSAVLARLVTKIHSSVPDPDWIRIQIGAWIRIRWYYCMLVQYIGKFVSSQDIRLSSISPLLWYEEKYPGSYLLKTSVWIRILIVSGLKSALLSGFGIQIQQK